MSSCSSSRPFTASTSSLTFVGLFEKLLGSNIKIFANIEERLHRRKCLLVLYLFIAHDLSMVKYISDRSGVLHLGYLVETGTTEEVFSHPIHPYTKSLPSAVPHPNPEVEKRRRSMACDKEASGIDYEKGTEHLVEGTHTVLATPQELEQWL